MNAHMLLAFLVFLRDSVATAHPEAPADSCWPTTVAFRASARENRRFFPYWQREVSESRNRGELHGWLEVRACSEAPTWHPCEHWVVTEAGVQALQRMNTEGCGSVTRNRPPGCHHRPIGDFKHAA